MKEISISTSTEKLDFEFIHDFISKSYWGKGRTMEQTQKAAQNSLNFGIFFSEKQIGYARIVTDFTIFGYLMDVFITPEHRGRGFSKILIGEIINHPQLREIQTWKLATRDAHGLYEKFGFKVIEDPLLMMELRREIN